MKLEQKIKIVTYCLQPSARGIMWSAIILSHIFECNWKESEKIAEAWLKDLKEKKK